MHVLYYNKLGIKYGIYVYIYMYITYYVQSSILTSPAYSSIVHGCAECTIQES
jgi:hypothetical protein